MELTASRTQNQWPITGSLAINSSGKISASLGRGRRDMNSSVESQENGVISCELKQSHWNRSVHLGLSEFQRFHPRLLFKKPGKIRWIFKA